MGGANLLEGVIFTTDGLPEGLTLTPDGRLCGEAPKPGDYTVKIGATLNSQTVAETFMSTLQKTRLRKARRKLQCGEHGVRPSDSGRLIEMEGDIEERLHLQALVGVVLGLENRIPRQRMLPSSPS